MEKKGLIMNKEEIIEDIISTIAKNLESKEGAKKVIITQASSKKFELFDKISELLSKTKNVKEIFVELFKDFGEYKKFIQKFVPKCLGSGITEYLNRKDEFELLNSVKDFIAEEFNIEVELSTEEVESPAIPRKPKVELE